MQMTVNALKCAVIQPCILIIALLRPSSQALPSALMLSGSNAPIACPDHIRATSLSRLRALVREGAGETNDDARPVKGTGDVDGKAQLFI